jgi:Dolichyl-phosphate-mannose-protein mannosyltransferase
MGLRQARGLAAVIVVAILARFAVMWPNRSRPMDDPDNYAPLARSLALGKGFSQSDRPTAYRPPLYPLLLAPGVWLFPNDSGVWVRSLHLLLGAGTAGLVGAAGRRWGMSRRQIYTAALIVALDPVLVVQSRSVMTETLAAFLLAAALAAVADASWLRGSILGGLALGSAALCRPSTLAAAGLIALFSTVFGPGTTSRKFARTFILGAVVILVLLPWSVRNLRAFGEPIWTTTHGGFTLALANNAEYYADVLDGPAATVWSGSSQRAWQLRISRATSGMSEPEADRWLRGEALGIARDRPLAFARASLARLGRFWGLAPSAAVYPTWLRVITAAWTLPLWAALIWGMCRRDLWSWPRAAAPAIVLALSVVHAVYWTDLRMRAPIVPAIALIAASAWRWEKPDANRHPD